LDPLSIDTQASLFYIIILIQRRNYATLIKLKKKKASKKSGAERRRFPRVKAPVSYRPARTFGPRRRISDISLVGVHVYSDERFKKRKRLEIELFLPDGHSIVATARVVWIKELPPESDAPYDVGFEFINLPPHAFNELKYVLDHTTSDE